MAICISRALVASLLERAVASPNVEICGLLLGEGDTVREARAAANVAQDPARRFEIDPAVLLGVHRAARQGGLQVLGHYHSHPSGEPVPSACDAALALEPAALWLIVAPPLWGVWRAGDGGLHGRFAQVPVTLTDGEDDVMLASRGPDRQ